MGFSTDPSKLLKLQRQLVIVALIIFIVFALMQIGAYFADVLRILCLSLLLSYLVINAVDFLDHRLRNRALAVALVYVCLLGIAVVAGVILLPALFYQVTSLVTTTIDKLPQALQDANNAILVPLQQRFKEKMIDIKVMDVLTNFVAQLPKPDPSAIASRISDMALGTMTWAMYSISISVVTFYFLLEGHRMKEAVVSLFPKTLHPSLNSMAGEMDRALQAFFRGQIVLGMLFGIVMLGVYVALNVQYALLLSAFLAICEILPVIGPPIGFVPAVVSVAIHGSVLPGAKFMQIILLTAIFMVLQQIKDSVVAPRYMGNVIGMHPVMIFIAIMVGAKLDGVVGIILSIPAACVLSVLFSRLPIGDRGAPVSPVDTPLAVHAEDEHF